MPKLNSTELRTERMILNWLTPARWSALSIENKVRIYLKVYDKAVPSKAENKNDNFSVTMMPLIQVDGKPLKFDVGEEVRQ